LVEHCFWEAGVARSNRVIPIEVLPQTK